jgi:hypothetical protein
MQSVPYTFFFHFQTFLFFSLSEVDLESFQDTYWFAARASTLLLQVNFFTRYQMAMRLSCQFIDRVVKGKGKSKGKGHPRTGHEDQNME